MVWCKCVIRGYMTRLSNVVCIRIDDFDIAATFVRCPILRPTGERCADMYSRSTYIVELSIVDQYVIRTVKIQRVTVRCHVRNHDVEYACVFDAHQIYYIAGKGSKINS